MLGARVIATTSTAEKAERLKALGASDVINHRLARRAEPTDRLKLPEFTDSPAEGTGFESSENPQSADPEGGSPEEVRTAKEIRGGEVNVSR